MRIITAGVCIAMSLFHLYTAAFGMLPVLLQRSVHLTFALFLVFLIYPLKSSSENRYLYFLDLLLAALSVIVIGYVAFNYEAISARDPLGSSVSNLDIAMGICAILLILEATRRTIGIALTSIVIFALIYAYAGPYFPGVFAHRAWAIGDIISFMFLSLEGIFGIPLGVSATYAFLFILLGAFLYATGVGQLFIDLACSIAGKSKGGPAKIAVIASALFGMISGASVANVYGTGNFTIPMMKKLGYKPKFAGAVEAVASTGGQLMPPVMGTVAFVMADVTGIPYLNIAIAALVPAILYYLSLITMVHFEACKKGLKPLSKAEIPLWKNTLAKSYLLIPLFFLVYIISEGYTPFRAAFFTILLTVVVSAVKRSTRMGWRDVLKALERGARDSLMIAMATAAAGIVVGVVAMTGVGLMFTGLILSLAKGYLFVALFLTMLACMIMGMGIPTVPAYIVVASITIPTLMKLGVPIMSAHLFALYFAVIAVITPPVALAAYAGASIAGSNMLWTGVVAFRLGIVAYVVPYIFVYNPAILLIGTWEKIVPVVLTATIGTISLAVGLERWFVYKLRIYEVIAFVVGGFLLIVPGLQTDLIGFICIVVGLLTQYLGRPKNVGLGVSAPSGSS